MSRVNRQQTKGPFGLESVGDPYLVYRDQNCLEYNACLNTASRNLDWVTFTCTGCDLSERAREERRRKERAELRRVKPLVPRVPMGVFLKRIVNNSPRNGYTPENFRDRIATDVLMYYGSDSTELKIVLMQLEVIRHQLDNQPIDFDIARAYKEIKRLSETLGHLPSLYEIYLQLCAQVWTIK